MTEIPSMASIQDDDQVCLNIKKVNIIQFTSSFYIMSHLIEESTDRSREPGEKWESEMRQTKGCLKITLEDYGQFIDSGYYKLHTESFIIKQTHKKDFHQRQRFF